MAALSALDLAEIHRLIAARPAEEVYAAVQQQTTIGRRATPQVIKNAIRRLLRDQLVATTYGDRSILARQVLRRRLPRLPLEDRIAVALSVTLLTQKWLAATAGMSPRVVNYYVTARALPKILQGIAVAHAFGLTAEEFWGAPADVAVVIHPARSPLVRLAELDRDEG